MKKQNILLVLIVAVSLVILSSCGSADGDFTGSEYMPDMAHSIAYESNTYTYYGLNRNSDDTTYKKMVMPREPVGNTIPRGYAGYAANGEAALTSMKGMPVNGFVPYAYNDTEEDRLKATAELKNPFPATEAGLKEGKELYNIYCGICHGEKADGNGYLVRDDGGKYPAQPSNLMADEYKNDGDGRIYHAIMYGKNVMGHYKDKLSYEERWQVIHYIRSLQFGDSYLAGLMEEGEAAPSDEPSVSMEE